MSFFCGAIITIIDIKRFTWYYYIKMHERGVKVIEIMADRGKQSCGVS